MEVKRGKYGEIDLASLSKRKQVEVQNLVKGASNAAHVDEHGTWEFGAEFDKKQRGYATNWDLYAIGRDRYSKRTLIIIQVRQYVKQRKNWYPQVRKSYFLIGRNEDNTVFAHAVESRVIHAAIKAEADVIERVQSWIFGADYSKVIRQGDLALIPVSKPKSGEPIDSGCILERSHQLTAERAVKNEHLYAFNPQLKHLPATHPDVAGEGWYKIAIGKRAAFWDFAAPTID